MKAITILPGKADSVSLREVPDPPPAEGSILVRGRELGICGTDFELISGDYGAAPQASDYLVLGHESLGEVEAAPQESGFAKGDLVVGIVRRPDPEPCIACAAGEWDMCRNGKYTERGIKEHHGFGSEFWRIEPGFAVKLDPGLQRAGVLMEPASILAKAWDHIERIGMRAKWEPRTLLVTGAGPIGLLAALMGAQRNLEVHVLDRVEEGLKPQLVAELGAKYHTGPLKKIGLRPEIIIECTGVAAVLAEAINQLGTDGILCMVGSSSHAQPETIDVGGVNRALVLGNRAIFGTVNANRHHYELAQRALVKADQQWLARLISRRERFSDWEKAFQRQRDDIKVVIEFDQASD